MATTDNIINTLGNKLQFAAMPSKFEVEIEFPGVISAGTAKENFKFMCKTSVIPEETIGEIIVGYQGQKLKIPGDREYGDWTCTVYNSEEWDIRNTFEKWMKVINDSETNLKTPWQDIIAPSLKIKQLSAHSLEPIATYVLKGAWPKTLGEISLDWDSNDEIETFDITMSYMEHTRE